jgi:branched-chain amino acid transport system ATP-binding protein
MSENPESTLSNPVLLNVDRLSIFYEKIQATWEVNFSVKEQSITALVGSNGAGKTAIMKSICGVLPQTAGSIVYQDKFLDKLQPYQRVNLGISLVPEGRKLFPFLTVKENLEIGAFTKRARRRLRQTMGEIHELFPILAKRSNQLAVTLSGGEQQMLAIGRGLMSCPKLLMLDEPSLGLAPIIVKRVFDTIQKINAAGVSILLVEQNVSQTLKLAQVAYILETGHIVMHGKGSELLENPEIKKSYLGF